MLIENKHILHLLLYCGDICDWLVDSQRSGIGLGNTIVASRNISIKLVEAATVDALIYNIIGTRETRGGKPLPMNGKQCCRILDEADEILSILEGYLFFERAKKVLRFFSFLLFTCF